MSIKRYRPKRADLTAAFKRINHKVFDDILDIPEAGMIIDRLGDLADGFVTVADGMLFMAVSDNFASKEHFMDTVAHEMVHVWQRQVLGRQNIGHNAKTDHDRTFRQWIPICYKAGYEIL